MADPDAYTRPYQLTKTMRRGLYPAIDQSQSDLSAAGKVVIITGAGGGIGYDIATTWATAGASGIVLAGRYVDMLNAAAENVKSIDKDLPTLVEKTDVTSEADVKELYEEVNEKFGRADVVVNNAATGGVLKHWEHRNRNLVERPCEKHIEVNVKSTYLMTHYYIKQFGAKGTFVNIISFGGFRRHEGRGMLVGAFEPFAKDTGISTGGLTLYLSTPKADHLRGGKISVNWDVDEMEEHKSEIVDKKLLKIAL